MMTTTMMKPDHHLFERGILILLLLCLSPLLSGQSTSPEDDLSYGERKVMNRKNAKTNIQQLKEGVLLVRLQTSKPQIKALEKRGNDAWANKVRKEQASTNQEIVQAFQDHFTFCDFYFFYADKSDSVRNGNYHPILMDTSLELIHKREFKKPVYILSTGSVYFEAFQSSYKGLAVMDRNFNQLKDPFPYYVKKREGLFFLRRSYTDMIQKLQEELKQYYEDNT